MLSGVLDLVIETDLTDFKRRYSPSVWTGRSEVLSRVNSSLVTRRPGMWPRKDLMTKGLVAMKRETFRVPRWKCWAR